MRRVWHPYQSWEEYHFGMWREISKAEHDDLLPKAIDFTGDCGRYGAAMLRVVEEWRDTDAWLSSLRRLGSVVIVEAAGLDSHRVAARGLTIPPNASLLGVAPSHLNADVPRSIYMLSGGR